MKTTNLIWLCAAGAMLAGCHTDMWVQPKHQHPQSENEAFEDGNSSRPNIEGTVAFGKELKSKNFSTGMEGGQFATVLPASLTIEGKTVDTRKDLLQVLKRGKERFTIFCSHCHGDSGDGKGMIAQRGLSLKRPPASYHTERLRNMPIGHFVHVMKNGYGVMYSQAPRVQEDDRWAIASYIRALQMSQNVPMNQLSPEDLEKVKTGFNPKKPKEEGDAHGGH